MPATRGIVPSNIYVYFNSKFEIFYAAYKPWLKKRLVRLGHELLTIKDPNQKLAHIINAVWVRMPKTRMPDCFFTRVGSARGAM